MSRSNSSLTQTEQEILQELDRLIDYAELAGKILPKITLSAKQMNAFNRVYKKAQKYPRSDYGIKINISVPSYRGIKLEGMEKQKIHTKKDLIKMEI